MKKQKILILLLLTMITPCLWAQKKELSQARSYIKSGKDLEKAEKLMVDLLADSANPANRENTKIYLTWLDAVRGQFNAANEKLYLKQNYDTAAFFNLTLKMYDIATALDSLDMRPDSKGRIKPLYRNTHAAWLNQLRPNLYYGGTYMVRMNDYEKAFNYFDRYINAYKQPLFSGYQYATNDSLISQAAYWATLCGFKLHDAARTLRFRELAMRDKEKEKYTLQYVCEAYLLQNNEDAYQATLRKGFEQYPDYPYFFPRLADYYKAQGRNDIVLQLAEAGLKSNADSTLVLLAKSIALLNLNRYDECIEVSKQLLATNDQQPEPYFNISTCYLNQALAIEQLNEPRKNRLKLTKLYTDACPYMEKYRELAPADSQRWGPALYRIYLHLNKGKQFEEIDRLMRKAK